MWDENSATTHTSLKYCLHVCVFSAWKPPVFTLCVRLGLVVFIPEKAHTAWLAVYPPPAVCRVKSVGLVSETRLVVNQPAVFLSRLIQRVHALKKNGSAEKPPSSHRGSAARTSRDNGGDGRPEAGLRHAVRRWNVSDAPVAPVFPH